MNQATKDWLDRIIETPSDEICDIAGIEMRPKSGRIYILCPDHEDEHYGSCVLTAHGYYCFACHAKGNSIQLVSHANKWGFYQAADYLARNLGMESISSVTGKKADIKSVLPVTPEQLRYLGLYEYTTKVQDVSSLSYQKTDSLYYDNDYYIDGPYESFSMRDLYRENANEFHTIIKGKVAECLPLYIKQYTDRIWSNGLICPAKQLDIQLDLEKKIDALWPLAKRYGYNYKYPEKQKARRYKLQFV